MRQGYTLKSNEQELAAEIHKVNVPVSVGPGFEGTFCKDQSHMATASSAAMSQNLAVITDPTNPRKSGVGIQDDPIMFFYCLFFQTQTNGPYVK